jgi:hypothetical protein
MLAYPISNLGPDEAGSFAQMTALLRRVASRTPFGDFIAQMIARRYYDALASHADDSLREQLWRDFFVALNAFIVLRVTDGRAELDVLRSIVAENADLLPHFNDRFNDRFLAAALRPEDQHTRVDLFPAVDSLVDALADVAVAGGGGENQAFILTRIPR